MEPGNHVLQLNETEVDDLKWAQNALRESYGGRPTLEGFQLIGKRLYAADGFRAHSIPAPEELQDGPTAAGVVYLLNRSVEKFVAVKVTSESPVNGLRALKVNDEDQACAFIVNANFLMDALQRINENPNSGAVLRVYNSAGKDEPAILTVEAHEPRVVDRVAFIMLMTAKTDPDIYAPKSMALVEETAVITE